MAPLSLQNTFTEGVVIINQLTARLSAIGWPTEWDQEIDHS